MYCKLLSSEHVGVLGALEHILQFLQLQQAEHAVVAMLLVLGLPRILGGLAGWLLLQLLVIDTTFLVVIHRATNSRTNMAFFTSCCPLLRFRRHFLLIVTSCSNHGSHSRLLIMGFFCVLFASQTEVANDSVATFTWLLRALSLLMICVPCGLCARGPLFGAWSGL